MSIQKLYRSQRKPRCGAAVVELAICMPVIVLLIFASLEGANMLFLRQAVVQSAYEGAKAAAKSNGSQAQGLQLAQDVLSSRGVAAPTVQFVPANIDNLPAGTPFSVTVSVPGDSRSITKIGPFGGLIIDAQATMTKE